MRRDPVDLPYPGDWVAIPMPEKGVDPLLWTWKHARYVKLNWNKRYPRLENYFAGVHTYQYTYKLPSRMVVFTTSAEAARYANEHNRLRNICKQRQRKALSWLRVEDASLQVASYEWTMSDAPE